MGAYPDTKPMNLSPQNPTNRTSAFKEGMHREDTHPRAVLGIFGLKWVVLGFWGGQVGLGGGHYVGVVWVVWVFLVLFGLVLAGFFSGPKPPTMGIKEGDGKPTRPHN